MKNSKSLENRPRIMGVVVFYRHHVPLYFIIFERRGENVVVTENHFQILRPHSGSVGKRRVLANDFCCAPENLRNFPNCCKMCVPQLREIVPKTHNVNVCVHSVAQNCDKNKCYFKVQIIWRIRTKITFFLHLP